MNLTQMREYISNAYPGEKWKARCACMHSNQVIAIYHSLQSRDRDKKKKQLNTESVNTLQKPEGIQLTIFDVM